MLFRSVILAVGYLGEMIEAHLGSKFSGCDLIYSYETSALGTGGAIRQAMDFTSASHVFVSNGDTFINANFSALESAFERHPNLAASISVIHESNADRFAFVHWDKNTDLVTAFSNKGAAQSGWINAGLYCLKVDKFKSMTTAGKFSIEQDFFEKRVDQAIIAAVALDSQFIDIGVPTDYEKAQSFIPQYSAQLR